MVGRQLFALLAVLLISISAVKAQYIPGPPTGANSSITSITGLTTPLSTAQGGTGYNQPVNQMLSLFRKTYAWWFDPGATTVRFIGVTQTPAGTASNLNETGTHYVNYASAASTDALAGLTAPPAATVKTGYSPTLFAKIKTGAGAADITNCRILVGWTTSSSTPFAADAATLRRAHFSYITGTHGTAFWRCCTDNNTGTQEVTVTTVAVAADTQYNMIIDSPDGGTTIKFYLASDTTTPVLVATHTTNVPANTVQLQAFCGLATTENSAKNIRVAAFGYTFN